ncbi:cytochrome P450 [Purpureocillium lavendulum]|uniref:Cytochrome P450 n=1 Tax=Purpureocillium lavendulum TaxID=1247861 RepID=A0AB34FIG1_9HYPO|nr:cytochrome P450 [Purpureocillium lavendulum]
MHGQTGAIVDFVLHHWLSIGVPLLVAWVVRNRYHNGLNEYPGPFLASLTDWWRFIDVWGRHPDITHVKLHEEYGDVVRLGPNTLSFADPAALKTIYGLSKGFVKSDFYVVQKSIVKGERLQSLFSTTDNNFHQQFRRCVNSAFSMSALVQYEPLVDNTTKLFLAQTQNLYGGSPEGCDFTRWLQFYAFDVIGETTYSTRHGFVERNDDVDGIASYLSNLFLYVAPVGQIPFIDRLLLKNPIYLKLSQWGIFDGTFPVARFAPARMPERLPEMAAMGAKAPWRPISSAAGEKPRPPDLLSKFLAAQEVRPDFMTDKLVQTMAVSMAFAGSETTAISLAAIFYYLLRNPRSLIRLQTELNEAGSRNLFSDYETGLVTWGESQKLPYLDACIKEAFRLHPAAGLPLERVVPEPGAEIAGRFVKGGTIVGCSAWVIHRRTEIFGDDVNDYRPERWIPGSGETELRRVREMNGYMFQFGMGPRTCIGKNISLLEIYKLVPSMLRSTPPPMLSLKELADEPFADGVEILHYNRDADVDICFVHGLTGNRNSTWTATGQSGPWPKLLLPSMLGNVRILTYGYDAYIVRKSVASINGLSDHAKNLLNDLTTNRAGSDVSSRPVIFVAHSLGGLVCKEAVLLSRNNPEPHLRGLFDCTKGIVFMGTPHRGSWMADWAKIPASTLGIVKSTNRFLLKILETDDAYLQSVQDRFWSMIRELQMAGRVIEVTCFFEELPVAGVGIGVPKDSATLESYNAISIHANHSNMVKFSSVDENGFKRLLGELLRWESRIRNSATRHERPPIEDAHVVKPANPPFTHYGTGDQLNALGGTQNVTKGSGSFIDDVAILAWAKTTEETCTLLQAALREAEDWASSHASVFAPDKFQLTHFTRAKSRIDTSTPLQTRWGVINPKPTCQYLGVTMDSKLRWRQHIDEMERKVSKTIAALSCLGNSAWGVRTKEMRTVYRGVAVPQMMYACSAWSNAGWPGNGYTQKTLRKVQSLRGRAARVMSGAYKATSLPALDVEMHLLPIEQQIWKHNIEALDRIGAPSLRPTRQSQRRQTKISPREAIQKTIHDREVNSWTQEQIDPFVAPPWWQGPQTYIEETAEEARKKHLDLLRQEKAALHIYTDGSGINGQIGAAAVCPTIQQTRSSYMGTEGISTVYAGELQGISLALDIAQHDRAEGYRRSKVVIYTDNQAAIRPSAKPKGKSGAYLLKKIVSQTATLQEHNLPIEIRWVPAHTGVQGNEDADRAAKEATGWRERGAPGPRAEMPAELYSLRSTMKT